MKKITKYLGVLAAQGGGAITLIIMFGFDPIVFFKNNRELTILVLLIHFAIYMIIYHIEDEEKKNRKTIKEYLKVGKDDE